MPDFPTPFPLLTRVRSLNSVDTAIADLTFFTKEFIALIVLGSFSDIQKRLEWANSLCLEESAHPLQRVLWINNIQILSAVKLMLDNKITEGFPDKEYSFENIRAISTTMKSEEVNVAYLIYIDPSLSPDPKDKFKKFSKFQMSRAFTKAIILRDGED